jgi:hypothetical protein
MKTSIVLSEQRKTIAGHDFGILDALDSDSYIPRIGLHILMQTNGQAYPGNI